MLNDDVLYLSVEELGHRLKARELSPVELTQSYLERSARLGPKLNAYATLTRERALREAKEAEREINAGKYRGPLHGVPYAAKDLLAVRGYPTTWGARPYAKQRFDYDATVVRKLRDAGAVLLGKAAMIELAGSFGYRHAAASLAGPCKNPWNVKHWAGGSSSGSGAAVAAGLSAFALSTETWGSIVCPAAFCGVTGLRPTYGRVSRHGCMAAAYSMDKIGCHARTAADCGLVLAAIAGPDPNDPSSLPDSAFAADAAEVKPLRIGWCKNAFKTLVPKEAAGVVAKAVEVFRQNGAEVAEAELPEGPWDEAAGTIISVECGAAFDELLTSGRALQLDDPLQRINGYVCQQIPAADYLRSQRLRADAQRRIDKLFERFDVLVAAAFPVPSTPLDANLESEELNPPDPLGALGNLCGLPAASVPCGFTDAKLPLGLQLIGRVLDEHKVLAAARLYQQNTDWHRKRPPLT